MIDIKEIEILNSTKCDCGHEFTLNDFTTLEQLQDAHGFYSNLVKHYCQTFCPKCGKQIILLLKQKGQTWEIMNTAVLKNAESTFNEIITNTEETVENLEGEKVENNNEETTTNENETENNSTEEFICPVCEKVCKNKSGLTAHMRTHQN